MSTHLWKEGTYANQDGRLLVVDDLGAPAVAWKLSASESVLSPPFLNFRKGLISSCINILFASTLYSPAFWALSKTSSFPPKGSIISVLMQ